MRNAVTHWSSRPRLCCGLAILALACFGSLVLAKGYMSPEFQQLDTRPTKLALLPPQADFIKAKTLMTEEMVKESHTLEDSAVDALVEDLRSRACEVTYLSVEDLSQNAELRDLVSDINERFDEEWLRMIGKPKHVRGERYSVDESAVRLCSMLEVDALLISRIQAVQVTAGKAWLSAWMGAAAQSYARLDLSIIDGSDGEIEAYFYSTKPASTKMLKTKPTVVMAKVEKKCLKPMPRVDEAVEIKYSEGAEEAEKDPDEEAVMAEFQAILAQQSEEKKEPD